MHIPINGQINKKNTPKKTKHTLPISMSGLAQSWSMTISSCFKNDVIRSRA